MRRREPMTRERSFERSLRIERQAKRDAKREKPNAPRSRVVEVHLTEAEFATVRDYGRGLISKLTPEQVLREGFGALTSGYFRLAR